MGTEIKPLYKVLNETRTQGIIEIKEHTPFSKWLSIGDNDIAQISNINVKLSPLDDNYDKLQLEAVKEERANAAYIVIAVNNFAQVCEALERIKTEGLKHFNNYANGKEVDFKTLFGAAIEISSETLNNIK